MDSHQLARYIEETDGISKPWLLVQIRLAKLQETKDSLTPEAYAHALEDIHQDLMNLGQWWKGQENQVFNA